VNTDRLLKVSFTLSLTNPINTSIADAVAAIKADIADALGISPSRVQDVTFSNFNTATPTVTFNILDASAVSSSVDANRVSLAELQTELATQSNDASSPLRSGTLTGSMNSATLNAKVQNSSPKKKSCTGDIGSFDFSGCWWIYVVIIVGIIIIIVLPVAYFVYKRCKRPKSQAMWGPQRSKPEEYEIDFNAGEHEHHEHHDETPHALPDIEMSHPMSAGKDDDENIVIE
jgi:hypothetical protein